VATTNTIVGANAADAIPGTSGNDLIYGYDPSDAQAQTIVATRVATGLASPLFATAPPGDATRLFIVERGGQIEILDLRTGQVQPTPFLDVSSQVATTNEQGLLGLAFDPDFATNGTFYINLTNTRGDTEIRSYRVSPDDPGHADPASAQLVLSVDQPDAFTNHKGGWLGFGPDGRLYVALGDGGGAGDPFGNAQNPDSPLGKILRLDAGSDAFPADAARNYAIPVDNPFVGRDGADEVWALGLRNPWRDSFDRASGDFLIADVGQDAWEEIDIGRTGANYGWPFFEGPAAFGSGAPPADAVPPIAFYDHSVGESITGGYIYRGEGEALQGEYFFADFISGRVWTLRLDGQPAITERTANVVADAGTINSPSSFGEDGLGNLYLTDFDGDVFRLTPQTGSGDGADQIHGADGDDFIFGGAGADAVSGEAGNDMLHGQTGDDALTGGPGIDTLGGGVGNDRLEGGPDNDLLAGGAGADVFAFAAGFGHDRIADFIQGQDAIELPASLANSAAVLNGSRQVGPDTIITIGAADTITLQGVAVASLTAGDFHFV